MDSSGNVKWTETYGQCNIEDVPSFVLTNDNKYLLLGATQSIDFSAAYLYAVQTDTSGGASLSCFENSINAVTTNEVVTENLAYTSVSMGICDTSFGFAFCYKVVPLNSVVANSNNIAAITLDCTPPSAAFTFSGDTCAPSAITFTDLSDDFPYIPVAWAWTFGTGAGDTLQNPIYTYNNASTYTTKLITTWVCYSDSDSVSITIYPLPQPVLGNDTSFCEFGLIAPNASFNAYNWSNGQSGSPLLVTTSGNYFVNVTDSFGCSNNSDTILVTINPLPTASLGNDTFLCTGTNFDLIINDTNLVSYLWNTSDTNFSINVSVAGQYIISFMDTNNCSNSDTINIAPKSKPVASSYNDKICQNSSLVLNTGNALSYSWSPGLTLSDSTIETPTASPNLTTSYQSILSNECGTDTAFVDIEVIACSFYLPNAFSPNGDGFNDVFLVRGDGISTMHLVIYDRWGNKVFESESSGNPSVAEGWKGTDKNGRVLSEGVYVYRLTLEMLDSSIFDEKGNITLIH